MGFDEFEKLVKIGLADFRSGDGFEAAGDAGHVVRRAKAVGVVRPAAAGDGADLADRGMRGAGAPDLLVVLVAVAAGDLLAAAAGRGAYRGHGIEGTRFLRVCQGGGGGGLKARRPAERVGPMDGRGE